VRNSTGNCGTTRPDAPLGQVHAELQAALIRGDEAELERLAARPRRDRRDAALCLAVIHDLHLSPIDSLDDVVRYQHHPAISALKARLEADFVRRLDRGDRRAGWRLPEDPVAAMRAVSARDQVPVLYRWLAEEATIAEVRDFLRYEGGPDGARDDGVARRTRHRRSVRPVHRLPSPRSACSVVVEP
jgi:hypothetical protein